MHYFLEDNKNKTFTAYLKLEVAHDLCYDPLIGKNLFNVRIHRPINVVAKEYEWNDRVLNDNRLAIKDLVEVVDWNRFPVVAYNTAKISARNTMFGIEQPAYSTVYGAEQGEGSRRKVCHSSTMASANSPSVTMRFVQTTLSSLMYVLTSTTTKSRLSTTLIL